MNARTDTSRNIDETCPYAEWAVAVVYEDRRSRDCAMKLLDALELRFRDELVFSCTWWKFRYLLDPDIGRVARHYAASAEIIIFVSGAPGLFPLPIMNWIESWTMARNRKPGALVPLFGSSNIPAQLYSTKHVYLRSVAERAGLDYLTQSLLPGAARIPSRANDKVRHQ